MLLLYLSRMIVASEARDLWVEMSQIPNTPPNHIALFYLLIHEIAYIVQGAFAVWHRWASWRLSIPFTHTRIIKSTELLWQIQKYIMLPEIIYYIFKEFVCNLIVPQEVFRITLTSGRPYVLQTRSIDEYCIRFPYQRHEQLYLCCFIRA